jgi:hypothetical protein
MPTDTVMIPEDEVRAYHGCLKHHNLEPSEHVLIASLGEKKLFHFKIAVLVGAFPVSSGSRPRSCRDGSLGTPWGLHEICTRHGDGEPAGMVFRGRVAIGKRWQDDPGLRDNPTCLVTTRILRLRGLEPGLNAGPGVDTHDRFIYIHGTNHPERFPDNISSGCLVMRDEDLIGLFEQIPEGTHVWLGKP